MLNKLNSRMLAIISQLMATAIFSFHYVAAKKLLYSLDAFALIALRGIIGGGLLFGIFILSQKKWKFEIVKIFKGKNFLALVVMILLGYSINQWLFIHGLKLTTPDNIALLSNSLPLFVYFFAILFRQEKGSRQKSVALILGFLLISIYLWHTKNFLLSDYYLGNLLVLSAFMVLACSLLISRKQMVDLSPSLVSSIMLFGGGVSIYALIKPDLATAFAISFSSFEFILLFIFEVVISSLAWYLNFYAIKKLGASTASSINFLQIPVSAFLGFIYLGIQPDVAVLYLTVTLLPVSWYLIQSKS